MADWKKIIAAIGKDDAEAIAAAKDAQTEFDGFKSASDESAGKATAAEKALAKATKAAEKSTKTVADLEAKLADSGTTDDARVTKLTAELATAKEASVKLTSDLHSTKLRHAIAGKFEGVPAERRVDAMTLFGNPDGVDLDAEGKLVGFDKPFKSFQESKAYLFAAAEGDGTPPKPGHGGAPKGAKPGAKPPSPGDGTIDAAAFGATIIRNRFATPAAQSGEK